MIKTGVKTPTMYNGDRKGEIFFRKYRLSIIGRKRIKIINHLRVQGFDDNHIFQFLNDIRLILITQELF